MSIEQAVRSTRIHARAAPTIAILNDRWRVIDDPLQWILQVRQGQETFKSSGWKDRAYCAQRTALIRCIREYCGDVSSDALAVTQALPSRHPDYDTLKNPAAICGGYRVENHSCRSGSNAHPARRKPYDHT